jgi:hypothetical protein
MNIFKIISKRNKTLILAIAFISFVYVGQWSQTTKLYDGLGIDGMWYHKIILDDDYKPNDYHLFKSFPSYLLKHSFNILGIGKTLDNVVLSFKLLNYISIVLSAFVCFKICKLRNLTEYQCSLYMFLVFCSFLILCISGYDPVTPDYFAFLLSFSLLFFILNKNHFYTFSFLLISFFTNPLVFLIGMVLLIFSDTSLENMNQVKVSRIAFFLSGLFGILILFWATYMIVPMHRAGIELTKFHIPDTLDIELFPVSALIVSAFCSYLSYPLFYQSIHFIHFKYLLKVNFFWFVIFISFMILKSIVVDFNNSPTKLDDIGHLLYIWPLYFCMKPLNGVSEHIHSLGILIILALLMWRDLVSKCSKLFGLGGLILLGLFVLFLIKPEARHTIPFVPFVSLLVVRVIPEKFNNALNVLLLLCTGVLLSKIYYPLQLGVFSGDPQDFPAQHYFMFFGFSCNYTMYIIQIIISILALVYFKKLISPYELSSLQK